MSLLNKRDQQHMSSRTSSSYSSSPHSSSQGLIGPIDNVLPRLGTDESACSASKPNLHLTETEDLSGITATRSTEEQLLPVDSLMFKLSACLSCTNNDVVGACVSWLIALPTNVFLSTIDIPQLQVKSAPITWAVITYGYGAINCLIMNCLLNCVMNCVHFILLDYLRELFYILVIFLTFHVQIGENKVKLTIDVVFLEHFTSYHLNIFFNLLLFDILVMLGVL